MHFDDNVLSRNVSTFLWISMVLCAYFFLFIALSIGASKSKFSFSQTGKAASEKTALYNVMQIQQGNDFRVWLGSNLVMGKAAFENADPPVTCGAVGIGCDFPLGACLEHLYGMGPWIGGNINGVPIVSTTYREGMSISDFSPELIADTAFWVSSVSDTSFNSDRPGYYKRPPNRAGIDDDGDGKIDEDELDGLDNDHDWVRATDDIGSDGVLDSLEVGCKGVYDAVTNPDPAFDNYNPSAYDSCHPNHDGTYPRMYSIDKYKENNGLPDHGEPRVDEDYGTVSDRDIYVASTDSIRAPIANRRHGMYIKVIQKSYFWDESIYGDILPMDYYFVNIGKNTISDVYLGFFANMNVGPISNPDYKQNNYAAYFPDIHTAYVHNPIDRGSTPLALTLVNHPKPNCALNFVFQWFDSTRSLKARTDSELYDWMSGKNGLIQADQPLTQLSDTKFLYSFGPFDAIQPGETLKIRVALVTGNCIEYCPGDLKDNAYIAIHGGGIGDTWPYSFPAPRLKLTPNRGKIMLEWGSHLGGTNPMKIWDDSSTVAERYPSDNWRRINPPEGHSRGGRIFEGFRVYRSENVGGWSDTYKLLRDFDVSGDEFGGNTGIDTVFVDTNVVAGKTYWYSVTAYTIPDIHYERYYDAACQFRIDTINVTPDESSLRNNAQKINFIGIEGELPATFKLHEAFPNPFNPSATIPYYLPQAAHVTIEIYNMLGEKVTTLINNQVDAGDNFVRWDGTNQSGLTVSSAMYLCRMTVNTGTETFKQTTKLILAK
jgi:hypothetical protein